MDFIAKNLLPGQSDRQLSIPTTGILSPGDLEDLSLCKIQALQIYMEAARPLWCSGKRRFIPLLIVSRTTISFWLLTTGLHLCWFWLEDPLGDILSITPLLVLACFTPSDVIDSFDKMLRDAEHSHAIFHGR